MSILIQELKNTSEPLSLYLHVQLSTVQWYYDEHRIFPIEAILKQTSSLYEKKNTVYEFQISLLVPEMIKFLKYANYQVMTSYTQPNFDQI